MVSRAALLRGGFATGALAYGTNFLESPALGDESVPLRVATATSDSYGEAYYALDGGYFKQAGLSATIGTYGNGSQSLAALSSGDADVALTNPISLVQAIERGLPFTCIAGGCCYVATAPTTALFIAKDAPFRSAKDLEGKTVALGGLKDVVTAALKMWLSLNGADPAKVSIVEVPFPEMAAAVKRGIVAAASIPEPFMSANKSELRMLARHMDSVSRRFYISVWASTSTFGDKSRPVVKRFTNAIYATARWANANHDKTGPILAKYAKVDADSIATMTRATYATNFEARDLQSELDAAYKFHLFQSPQRAEQLFAGA